MLHYGAFHLLPFRLISILCWIEIIWRLEYPDLKKHPEAPPHNLRILFWGEYLNETLIFSLHGAPFSMVVSTAAGLTTGLLSAGFAAGLTSAGITAGLPSAGLTAGYYSDLITSE